MPQIVITPVSAQAGNYCTLAELKAWAKISDTTDDTKIEIAIEAVSRLIDETCEQRFFTTDSDETRTQTAEFGDLLYLETPAISITSVETDHDDDRAYEFTWAASDYDLEPENAAADGKPYTRIRVRPRGSYRFPVGVRRGVRLTGKFGYASSTPAIVKQACLIQVHRLFMRKEAPFGVTGANEFGQVTVLKPRLDPDVQLMLAKVTRPKDMLGV